MLYQFLDWRLVKYGRKMHVVQVEKLLERLRAHNNGRLSLYLSNWEEYQIFAGEAGIMLPEMFAAAKAVFPYNNEYPTLGFLEKEYTKILQHLSENHPEMLKDDPPKATISPKPESFEEVVEGSISNVVSREGDEIPCLEQSPPILSPTSISTGSRNTLLTEVKPPPPAPWH